MIIVLDIETQTLVPTDRDLSRCSISIAGVRYGEVTRFFTEDDLPELFRLLDDATRIVGFNLLGFDYPVLRRYAGFDVCARYRSKTYDIMHVFEAATGRVVALQDLAQRTLGVGKLGVGKDAPMLFAQGRIDELQAYLAQDLLVTAQLFEHIQTQGVVRYGHIAYKEPVERSVALPR